MILFTTPDLASNLSMTDLTRTSTVSTSTELSRVSSVDTAKHIHHENAYEQQLRAAKIAGEVADMVVDNISHNNQMQKAQQCQDTTVASASFEILSSAGVLPLGTHSFTGLKYTPVVLPSKPSDLGAEGLPEPREQPERSNDLFMGNTTPTFAYFQCDGKFRTIGQRK